MSGRRELRRWMLVFVALALVASACSGTRQVTTTQASTPDTQTDTSSAGRASVSGSQVPWSEELAEETPLHVEAKVLSQEVMKNIDDPFWPLKDDPFFVEEFGETWVVAWTLEVVEWLKGVSTDEIRVTKVLERQPLELGVVPTLSEHDYDFVEAGGTYIFYLSLNGLAEGIDGPTGTTDDWERVEEDLAAHPLYRHWLLGRVERVEEATYPGVGATER